MVQLLMEPEDVCSLCHPRCTCLASPLWMKVQGQAPGLRGGLRLTSVPGTFTPARSAGGSSTALATWSGISSSTRVSVPTGRRGLGLVHGCPGSHASYCVRLLPAGFCSPSQQGPSLPITPSGPQDRLLTTEPKARFPRGGGKGWLPCHQSSSCREATSLPISAVKP